MKTCKRKETIRKTIFSTFSSSVLLLILTLMDFLSVGTKLIVPVSHNRSTEAVSMMLFIYPAVVAQIAFGIFTRIGSGIAAGPIVELAKIAQAISKVCNEKTSNFGSAMFNTYLCFSVATALYAAISFILCVFKAGSLLRLIPSTAVYGAMASVGLVSIGFGYEEIYGGCEEMYLHVFFIIAFVFAFIAFVIDNKFPGYTFLLPGFATLILILFYSVSFICQRNIEWLISHHLLPKVSSQKSDIMELLDYCKYENFRMEAISHNSKNIITMALFSLIHIPVNISGFSNLTGVPVNLDLELQTQSLGNLFSSLFGFPTYFICSYSVLFSKSGGSGKAQSIVAGFVLILIAVFGVTVRSYLPSILLAFIPLFIGLSFLYSYLYEPLLRLTIKDFTVTLISAGVACCLENPVTGLLVGVASNYLLYLHFSFLVPEKESPQSSISSLLNIAGGVTDNVDLIAQHGKERYIYLFDSNFRIVEIKGIVMSWSAHKLSSIMHELNENAVFDLRGCHYLDLDANLMLEEKIKNLTNQNNDVIVVGKPYNFYSHLFKNMRGVSVVGQQ